MTATPMKTTEPRVENKGPAHRHESDHPLLALRQEVDRLFDTFFSGFSLGPFGARGVTTPVGRGEGLLGTLGTGWGEAFPKMDITETDAEMKATVELPGMDEKDVTISVDGDILTIKGEKKDERKEEKEGYFLSERHYGAVERVIRLPETADQDKIDAALEKGVLTVTVPKTARHKKTTRKVEIRGG